MGMIGRRGFLTTVALVAWVGAIAPAMPSLRAAEDLPSRLSDQAFWKMTTDFSEEGGDFTSENFLSNEQNFQYVISRLQQRTKPGGVYMGVGPEQNFTYIAALQPRIAFIIDIRRQNMMQHLMYKAAFELSADRAQFLSLVFSRKRPEGLNQNSTADELFSAYFETPRDPQLAQKNLQAITDLLLKEHKFDLSGNDISLIEHVHYVFLMHGPAINYASTLSNAGSSRGGRGGPNYATLMTATDEQGMNLSFLGTEENFQFVKEMERKNLIVPIVGDFGGPKAIRAVGQYLKDHDATVTAFYLSNVEQYLFQAPRGAGNGGAKNFYNSVAALPLDSFSTFIRSANNAGANQPYSGFQSLLGSMTETIRYFKEQGFSGIRDILRLSQ